MTTERLDEATREDWIGTGRLDPVARVRAFSPLSDYPEELRALPLGLPEHPALRAPLKPDGSPNLNHAAYVRIGRAYQRAALVVVRGRPDVYFDRVRRAFRTWLRPPSDYLYVVPQREALGEWDRLHSRLLLWSNLDRRRAGPTLVLLPAAALFLAALLWRPSAERRRLLLLVGFPVLAVAWNFMVGNLVDVEENNRFRVEVEGLMVALGCWGLIEVARRAAAQLGARALLRGSSSQRTRPHSRVHREAPDRAAAEPPLQEPFATGRPREVSAPSGVLHACREDDRLPVEHGVQVVDGRDSQAGWQPFTEAAQEAQLRGWHLGGASARAPEERVGVEPARASSLGAARTKAGPSAHAKRRHPRQRAAGREAGERATQATARNAGPRAGGPKHVRKR
jgi:hypothetical protein